eukprot:g693.t1
MRIIPLNSTQRSAGNGFLTPAAALEDRAEELGAVDRGSFRENFHIRVQKVFFPNSSRNSSRTSTLFDLGFFGGGLEGSHNSTTRERAPLPWSTGQAEVSEKVVDMAANTVNDSFGKNADYNSQPGNDSKQEGQAEGSNSDNKQETIMLQALLLPTDLKVTLPVEEGQGRKDFLGDLFGLDHDFFSLDVGATYRCATLIKLLMIHPGAEVDNFKWRPGRQAHGDSTDVIRRAWERPEQDAQLVDGVADGDRTLTLLYSLLNGVILRSHVVRLCEASTATFESLHARKTGYIDLIRRSFKRYSTLTRQPPPFFSVADAQTAEMSTVCMAKLMKRSSERVHRPAAPPAAIETSKGDAQSSSSSADTALQELVAVKAELQSLQACKEERKEVKSMEQLTKDTLALHEDERNEKLKLQAQLTAFEERHKESLKQLRESKDRATELEADIKKKAYNADRSRKRFESAKATLKEERDALLLERDELARSLEEAKESALENSTAAEQVHSLQAEIKELKRNLEMQNAAAERKGQAANFESRYKKAKQAADMAEARAEGAAMAARSRPRSESPMSHESPVRRHHKRAKRRHDCSCSESDTESEKRSTPVPHSHGRGHNHAGRRQNFSQRSR